MTHVFLTSNNKIRWRGPPRADDLTSFHPEQNHWNLNNLPEILYVLYGEKKSRSNGARAPRTHESFGKMVRAFSVLPDQISSQVEGWRLEAWVRLDPRINAQDIIDRVNPAFELTKKQVDMRRFRFRGVHGVSCWGSERAVADITRKLIEKGIDPALNTTRGLSPGLINPIYGEDGGRIPIPRVGLVWDSTVPLSGQPPQVPGQTTSSISAAANTTGSSSSSTAPSDLELAGGSGQNGDEFVHGETNYMGAYLPGYFQSPFGMGYDSASPGGIDYLQDYIAGDGNANPVAGLYEYPDVTNVASSSSSNSRWF